MKFGKIKEKVYVESKCKFDENEIELLLEYATNNMPSHVFDELVINWALTDILQKQLKREKRKNRRKEKKMYMEYI